MSDLSWLNPTPHAIAVYASQPLSPVATQHSLPSGRYSLLGPDLHRLDRTSLRLAHLFDHLVSAGEQSWEDGETGHRSAGCPLLHWRANRDRPHRRTGISLRTQWQDDRTRQPHLIFGKRPEIRVLNLVD